MTVGDVDSGRTSIAFPNRITIGTKPGRNLTIFNPSPGVFGRLDHVLCRMPLRSKSDSGAFYPGWFTIAENHHPNTNTTTTPGTGVSLGKCIVMKSGCLFNRPLAAHLLLRMV